MTKEAKFKKFHRLLFKAIPSIEPKYMEFEAEGLVDGFMERTYAYELYHLLRKFQDQMNYKCFTIHAEPEKARTNFLKSIINRLKREQLKLENNDDFQKRVMPDILVHVPRYINENITVIEIKPVKKNLENNKGIEKDIRVLKEFVKDAPPSADAPGIEGYYKGIFLLYSPRSGCGNLVTIKERYSEIIKKTIGNNWRDYTDKICLIWHPGPKTNPKYIDWSS